MGSSTTTTVEDKEEATKKDEEAVVEDHGQEPEASKKASTPSDDEEDWTVVSDKKDKEDDHQGSLYPDLSETKPEEAATESSPTPTAPVANHPDPRIQVAIQAMMNMGFTNDGGGCPLFWRPRMETLARFLTSSNQSRSKSLMYHVG